MSNPIFRAYWKHAKDTHCKGFIVRRDYQRILNKNQKAAYSTTQGAPSLNQAGPGTPQDIQLRALLERYFFSSTRLAVADAVGQRSAAGEAKSAKEEEIAQSVRDNIDPTFMDPESARKLGAKQRTPGEHPGVFLHQMGSAPDRPTAKDLWPIYPLFGMVGLGLSLAVYTMYRMGFQHPLTEWKPSHRRAELTELEQPEEARRAGEEFAGGSGLRKFFKPNPSSK